MRLTQKVLAELAGVARVHIARIEAGRSFPGYLVGCKMARIINKNALWLAGLIDDPTPGIQFASRQEMENYLGYLSLTAAERAQFADMMADFLRARRIGRGETV